MKMKVNRFNKTDVVATSGTCEQPDAIHFYIFDENQDGYFGFIYGGVDGKMDCLSDSAVFADGYIENPVVGGWYHQEGFKFVPCTSVPEIGEPCVLDHPI